MSDGKVKQSADAKPKIERINWVAVSFLSYETSQSQLVLFKIMRRHRSRYSYERQLKMMHFIAPIKPYIL